jgi:hypothetical protein
VILTQKLIKQLMHYDPHTGVCIWLPRFPWMFSDTEHFSAETICKQWNSRWAGKPAGTINPNGHLEAKVFRKSYKLHALIWLYQTGGWPSERINHENDCLTDNRWFNLRQGTYAQTSARRRTTSKSGTWLRGAYPTHRRGKAKPWRASITIEGKRLHLGVYDTELEAHEAYLAAAQYYYGKFARAA